MNAYCGGMVALSNGTYTYQQNFNTLPVPTNNGETLGWVNDDTLSGWYRDLVTTNGGLDDSRNWSGDGSAMVSSVPALFNWGLSGANPVTDRALGFRVTTNQSASLGLVLKNNNKRNLKSAFVNFRGEQWRRSGQTNPTQLQFSYKIISNDVGSDYRVSSDTGFTRVQELDFTSPVYSSGGSGLDGNQAQNVVGLTHSINFDPEIKPGQSIIFRWDYPAYSFSGHGLSIDDLSVTFSPETRPRNPKISLIETQSAIQIELKWDAIPNSNYQIEHVTNLTEEWDIQAVVIADSNVESWVKNNADAHQGFYRIRSVDTVQALHVEDFGAVPGDGFSDTAGINNAIQAALQQGIPLVLFNAGTYELIETSAVQNPRNDNYIGIFNASNLTLKGAVDTEGRPATRLERQLNLNNDTDPFHTFDIWYSSGITIKNFVLASNPALGSTGRVISVNTQTDEVVVELLEGLSAYDGMRAASAHSWNLETKKLKRYGNSPKSATLNFGLNITDFWEVVNGSNGRQYKMSHSGWSDKVSAGDGISWHHASVTRNVVEVFYSQDFTFENVIMPNLSNMAMLAAYSRNLNFRKIRLEPENGNLAVGARDGFHLSNNSGSLVFEDSYFKGLRMDPLVIRRTYGIVREILQENKIIAKPGYTIPVGDKLRFWAGVDPVDIAITSVKNNGDGFYEYGLADSLPPEVEIGTALNFLTYSLSDALIRNCEFDDNFGSPIVNFEENVTVELCTFDNNAYQIKYGPNEVSGGFVRNNIFRNNLIENTSWIDIAHRDKPSCLLIHSLSNYFSNPRYNKNIQITGNTFRNVHNNSNESAIYIRNATDILITDNVFEGFVKKVEIDASTTDRIDFQE